MFTKKSHNLIISLSPSKKDDRWGLGHSQPWSIPDPRYIMPYLDHNDPAAEVPIFCLYFVISKVDVPFATTKTPRLTLPWTLLIIYSKEYHDERWNTMNVSISNMRSIVESDTLCMCQVKHLMHLGRRIHSWEIRYPKPSHCHPFPLFSRLVFHPWWQFPVLVARLACYPGNGSTPTLRSWMPFLLQIHPQEDDQQPVSFLHCTLHGPFPHWMEWHHGRKERIQQMRSDKDQQVLC